MDRISADSSILNLRPKPAAAWLLVAGSAFEIIGGTTNWLSGTGDQFVERSLGFGINSLVGPPAIIGIVIIVVGVIRAL